MYNIYNNLYQLIYNTFSGGVASNTDVAFWANGIAIIGAIALVVFPVWFCWRTFRWFTS